MHRQGEAGQVVPVLALGLLLVLLGLAALVVDVGSWYTAQRRLQSMADAAALAAVQELPGNPAEATRVAQDYAARNGGTLDGAPRISADTVSVSATAQAPAFFARALGIGPVTVRARAVARAVPLGTAARVVPIGVASANPVLACGPACFTRETTLTYADGQVNAPGAFGLLDLSNSTGAVGVPTLASWISGGYPDELPLGQYDSEPGNIFNGGPVGDAIDGLAASHAEILLPIYSSVSGSGADARYTVVGFAGFSISSWDDHLSGGATTITGYFREVIRRAVGAPGATYFGAKSVSLVG
jgi:hypothetical protein